MKSVAGIFLLSLALGAHAQQYEAGVHYQALPVPVQTANNDAVEVVEVFSYACVHCYNFEPLLATWVAQQGSGVVFSRTPAIFNPPPDRPGHDPDSPYVRRLRAAGRYP